MRRPSTALQAVQAAETPAAATAGDVLAPAVAPAAATQASTPLLAERREVGAGMARASSDPPPRTPDAPLAGGSADTGVAAADARVGLSAALIARSLASRRHGRPNPTHVLRLHQAGAVVAAVSQVVLTCSMWSAGEHSLLRAHTVLLALALPALAAGMLLRPAW